MKGPYIIAYDLGTGGNKASLYDVQGNCLADTFIPFTTLYPTSGWHEQRPLDWWQAVIESTKQLLSKVSINKDDIYCCGISGHSLGVVPLDRKGRLLRDMTPIWSDSRPTSQVNTFFTEVEEIQSEIGDLLAGLKKS